nr:AAA family ATPase [Candidatus Omnitrophota bacterium]
MKYIPRWLESRLAEVLKSHPVVVLTGPRQVGKSTLLEHAEFLKDWRYITLDDIDALEQAKEDPKGLLWEDRPTIIDEAQRCPELLLTVKYLVDKSNRRRNFILSGSGNISLRKTPRETLAGRAKYLHLTGFSYKEIHDLPVHGILDRIWFDREVKDSSTKLSVDVMQSIWRGSLPGVVLASNEKIALERLSSYIDTYIQR